MNGTHRTLLAIVCAAAIGVLAGCGSDGSVGVTAIASERGGADDRIVVTLPDGFVLGPGDSLSPDEAGRDASADATPAETLVEPQTPLPDTVVVVGDSLTVSAEDEIEAALTARGLDVLTIDGLESRRMANGGARLPPGVDAIEEILAAEIEPGLWVIALGTNDVGSGGDIDGFRSSVREVLALIPEEAPIVWVDLWIRGREEPIAEANEAIRSELRRWSGGAAVVDWFAHGSDDGVITGDGVHLTDFGRAVFADSIVEAIDSLYPE